METAHAMTGRVARIEARLDSMDEKYDRLDTLIKSSIDDIKATIKSEVGDLKSEQISDIRRQLEVMDSRIDGQNIMLGDVRTKQERWDTGAGVLNWLIKSLIGVGGIAAGYLGAKHLG